MFNGEVKFVDVMLEHVREEFAELAHIPQDVITFVRRAALKVGVAVVSEYVDEKKREIMDFIVNHPGPDSWLPPGANPRDTLGAKIQPGSK